MNAFTGTAILIRLALRRDRIRLPLWLFGLFALLAAQAAGNAENYGDEKDRIAAVKLIAASPALQVLRGAPTDTSLGALIMSDSFWLLAILAALMSALTVIRHTRQSEESGRSELIGAAPVGPMASLTSALIVILAANVVLSGLLTLALVINGLPVDGSAAAGLAVGAAGMSFGAVAAVTAQLSQHARTSSALAVATIGAAYLIRGVGDVFGTVSADGLTVKSAWPSWLSPMGWSQQIGAFDDNTWWVLSIPVAFSAVVTALAFRLSALRDFGLGILPAKGGPADAPRTLLSPLGLAWRLHRGSLLGWVIGMAAAGILFGSLGQQVEDLADNAALVETLSRLGGAGVDLSDTYFAAIMALVGAISAGYPFQVLLRMRSEESDGQLEHVLATAVPRPRWLASHVIWALVGTVALLVIAGAAAGLTYGIVDNDIADHLPNITGAALVQAPATLALASVVVAVFGLLPRWVDALSWGALTLALLLGPLGEIFDLPDAVRKVSPFSHTPAVPAAELSWTPLAVMTAAAIALAVVGTVAFDRRNLRLPT